MQIFQHWNTSKMSLYFTVLIAPKRAAKHYVDIHIKYTGYKNEVDLPCVPDQDQYPPNCKRSNVYHIIMRLIIRASSQRYQSKNVKKIESQNTSPPPLGKIQKTRSPNTALNSYTPPGPRRAVFWDVYGTCKKCLLKKKLKTFWQHIWTLKGFLR